jgi:hypothetical protein
MSAAIPPQPSNAAGSDAERLLERYGIARVTSEHFEYGGYRYTNLKDAVAEAERRSKGPR